MSVSPEQVQELVAKLIAMQTELEGLKAAAGGSGQGGGAGGQAGGDRRIVHEKAFKRVHQFCGVEKEWKLLSFKFLTAARTCSKGSAEVLKKIEGRRWK